MRPVPDKIVAANQSLRLPILVHGSSCGGMYTASTMTRRCQSRGEAPAGRQHLTDVSQRATLRDCCAADLHFRNGPKGQKEDSHDGARPTVAVDARAFCGVFLLASRLIFLHRGALREASAWILLFIHFADARRSLPVSTVTQGKSIHAGGKVGESHSESPPRLAASRPLSRAVVLFRYGLRTTRNDMHEVRPGLLKSDPAEDPQRPHRSVYHLLAAGLGSRGTPRYVVANSLAGAAGRPAHANEPPRRGRRAPGPVNSRGDGPGRGPRLGPLVRRVIALGLVAFAVWWLVVPLLFPITSEAVVNAQLVQVRAPIDGITTELGRQLGDTVGTGEPLVRFVNARVNVAQLSILKTRTAEVQARRDRLAAEVTAVERSEAACRDTAAHHRKGRVAMLAAGVDEIQAQLQAASAQHVAMKTRLTRARSLAARTPARPVRLRRRPRMKPSHRSAGAS